MDGVSKHEVRIRAKIVRLAAIQVEPPRKWHDSWQPLGNSTSNLSMTEFQAGPSFVKHPIYSFVITFESWTHSRIWIIIAFITRQCMNRNTRMWMAHANCVRVRACAHVFSENMENNFELCGVKKNMRTIKINENMMSKYWVLYKESQIRKVVQNNTFCQFNMFPFKSCNSSRHHCRFTFDYGSLSMWFDLCNSLCARCLVRW